MIKYISKEVFIKNYENLLAIVKKEVYEKEFVNGEISAGAVAGIIVTNKGNIYTGVCVEFYCGLGTCAERSAAFQMIKNNETEITHVLTIGRNGCIYPPCGACIELIKTLNPKNLNTKFYISKDQTLLLKELITQNWQDKSSLNKY